MYNTEGWSGCSFANNEPFSKATIDGFNSIVNRTGGNTTGHYPGNAKNYMVREPDDKKFIETGNLAFVQSHGNLYGPSLEYVPNPTLLAIRQYKWGNSGMLQWICVGGCDILGFPVTPDGHPYVDNNSYSSPSRWSDSFRGISGICGYRSTSWYQRNNTSLGFSYGATFVNALLRGETFYGAWVQAADYLHRSLRQKAEASVFINNPNSLNDTLASYSEARTNGLMIPAIRRRMVGRGKAAKYEYCQNVDYAGRCIRTVSPSLPNELRHPDVLMLEELSNLPSFAYTPSTKSIEILEEVASQLNLSNLEELLTPGGQFYSSETGGYLEVRDNNTITIHKKAGETDTTDSPIELAVQSLVQYQLNERSVLDLRSGNLELALDNAKYPVINNYGLKQESTDLYMSTSVSILLELEETDHVKSRITLSNYIDILFDELELQSGDQVDILSSEIGYTREGSWDKGQLKPCLYLSIKVIQDDRQTYQKVSIL